MKILMVLTSHDQLGNTGKKTGFWLEEFAAPYYAFKDAGAEVTLVSPKGGQPPLDPKSDEPDAQTAATRRFKADDAAQQALAHTGKLADVSAKVFDAVFYPGGHGPLWDLASAARGDGRHADHGAEPGVVRTGGASAVAPARRAVSCLRVKPTDPPTPLRPLSSRGASRRARCVHRRAWRCSPAPCAGRNRRARPGCRAR